jgi:hypothetical protein
MPIRNIGTVNGFVKSVGFFGRERFEFDGTTRGLSSAAVAAGATLGSKLCADFGGSGSDCFPMVLTQSGDGLWASKDWKAKRCSPARQRAHR